MLASRLVLFALFQAAIALLLAASGRVDPWRASAAWWPITASLTNLTTLTLLGALARREGLRLTDLYNPDRREPGRDLAATAGFLLLAAPVAVLPNLALAALLFGDPMQPVEMFVRPLPMWAATTGLVLFPITIALSELPMYFGYAMPRLEARWGRRGKALLVCAFFLAAQHATLPLLFDWRFAVWRAGMFLPFALLVGGAIRWRPSLLPYLMVVHGVIDFHAAWTVLQASP